MYGIPPCIHPGLLLVLHAILAVQCMFYRYLLFPSEYNGLVVAHPLVMQATKPCTHTTMCQIPGTRPPYIDNLKRPK